MTTREKIAEIIGWTPRFMKDMKDIESGCLCERIPLTVELNDKLDSIMCIIEESTDQKFKEGMERALAVLPEDTSYLMTKQPGERKQKLILIGEGWNNARTAIKSEIEKLTQSKREA